MLRIVPVKAFKDNYVWTLRNATHAAVVDPGEARPVLDYLSRERLELAAILATHHHPDHVGGIAELVATRPVPVYGPRKEPIPTLTRPVSEGDRVSIPELGVDFSVIDGVLRVSDGHLAKVDLPPLIEKHNALSRELLAG